MPNSMDNQDVSDDTKENKPTGKQTSTGPAMGSMPLSNKNEQPGKQATGDDQAHEDEGNFSSDNQKGKKVDADPSLESDKPIKE